MKSDKDNIIDIIEIELLRTKSDVSDYVSILSNILTHIKNGGMRKTSTDNIGIHHIVYYDIISTMGYYIKYHYYKYPQNSPDIFICNNTNIYTYEIMVSEDEINIHTRDIKFNNLLNE